MTTILIGHKEDLGIRYYDGHHVVSTEKRIERAKAIRNTVREMLSILAGHPSKLPCDLSEVMFYSTHLGQHVSIDAKAMVEDFIKHKRTKFMYDYTAYKPYSEPSEKEFISYFLRALQSLKTRLETSILKATKIYAQHNRRWPESHNG